MAAGAKPIPCLFDTTGSYEGKVYMSWGMALSSALFIMIVGWFLLATIVFIVMVIGVGIVFIKEKFFATKEY
jgi:hypothetical protein